MAQIQKGYEYDSTDPVKNVVTDDNLNALVGNATLLNGAISEQAPNSVTADTDLLLISKGGSLAKQTKGEFTNTINSNTINVNTVNAELVDADNVQTVDATISDDLAVGGDAAITGNLVVTSNTTANGNLTVNGTANLAGAFQVKGSSVNFLYEIFEHTPTPWTAVTAGGYNSIYTSPTFTKPSNEIWVFETYFQYSGAKGYNFSFSGRYGSQSYQTGNYIFDELMTDGAGGGSWTNGFYTCRWIVPAGTGIASDTFKVDAFAANGSQMRMFSISLAASHTVTTGTVSSSKFRIYKYKSA